MNLLMISGDRWVVAGKKSAFWYTLEEFHTHWDRIDVITPFVGGFDAAQPDKKERPFPNVHFHPSSRGLWYQPQWIVKKGEELIREHHHKVMTVHDYPPFYNGRGARKLSQKTGVPMVEEIHHIVGYPKPASATERIGLFLSKRFLPSAVRSSAATRVVNGEVKTVLAGWGAPVEKMHVVPSFYLDHSVLQPDPSATKKYDLVFCARLVANKGLGSALRAIAGMRSLTLLIVGDGPERPAMESLTASLGLRDRVTFTGWLPEQSDVMRALQSAKIFLMNSSSEGGPRVALEAMACGLPVISTKVGVMPDVIRDGENGIFTSGTPEDLRAKIDSLLNDTALRDRMGTEAERIVARFERKTLIKEYASFLQSVARS